jgi:hypothetical protein
MNRRLALIIAVFALAGARRAAAQDVSIGYQGLPYKAPGENKTGINLAEGVLLHVGAGAEAGWDSNVFYGSSSVPGSVISSGILRFSGFGQLTNAIRSPQAQGPEQHPGISYDARAGLTYRRYTSSDPNVEHFRSAFMPNAGLSLATGAGVLSFMLSDSFIRLEDPPYLGVGATATNPITRDNNIAAVQGQWSPGGGRITTTLRYTNTIDIFEATSGFSFSYASSLTHQLMLDASWKWLPKTALFIQASQGYVTYLSSNPKGKVSSYPLRVYAGLRGLITPKLTVSAALGYVNAFYASGATTSGFLGSSYVDVQAIILPSLLNRITLGYHQDFVNSVISNFYYDYSVYASYVQQVAGRLALDVSGRFSHRNYEGLLFDMGNSRADNVLIGGVTLDYFIRNWIYLGAGYGLTTDLSNSHLPGPGGAGTGTPVDYVKHQVFARLGITY